MTPEAGKERSTSRVLEGEKLIYYAEK